jgi:hypothetical protein
MATYNVNFTDSSKAPIEVEETGINEDYSIKFPGRIRLEWGKDVNENLLHLLENFAVAGGTAERSAGDVDEPSFTLSRGKLSNPVEGQLWFNKRNKRLYSYDKTNDRWVPYGEKGQQYGANWGQIRHGEKLPLPTSPSGYNFAYNECIWSVAPFSYATGFSSVNCFSDPSDSTVTMQYTNPSLGTIDGIANYLIVGIQRNKDSGSSIY